MNNSTSQNLNLAVAFLIASCAVSTVSAKTVAWYHLDEGTLGAGIPSSLEIVNAANPGTLTAHSRYIRNTDGGLESREEGMFAIAQETWGDGYGVFDPVSGVRAPSGRGFHFDTDWHLTPKENNCDAGNGTVLIVPHTAELALASFTIECFFKSDLTPNQAGGNQVLIAHSGSGVNGYSWALMTEKTGKTVVQMQHADATISTITVPGTVHDGRWHHLALSFDGATRKMSGCLDYGNPVAAELPAGKTAWYSGDGQVAIGGSPGTATWRKWIGQIDEVRISDTALDKTQFLRNRWCSDSVSSADTVCYVSFDQGLPTFIDGVRDLNCAAGTSGVVTRMDWCTWSGDGVGPGQAPTFDAGVKPADPIYLNPDSGRARTNEGSVRLVPNTDGNCAALYVDDIRDGIHSAFSGSWTAEAFLRLTETPKTEAYLFFLMHDPSTPSMTVLVNANNTLTFRFYDKTTGTLSSDYRLGICDGAWHHVAVTYDRASGHLLAYLDHKVVVEKSGLDFDDGVSSSYTPYFQVGGGYGAGRGHDLVGWIDEFRLSSRALGKFELLNVNRRRGMTLVIR